MILFLYVIIGMATGIMFAITATTEGGKSQDRRFIVTLVLLAGLMTFGVYFYEGRYKQGQVDALTDKVKYELVVHDDSTRTWQEIEE